MKNPFVALCAVWIAGSLAGAAPGPAVSPAPKPAAAPMKPAVPLAAVTLTDFKLTGNLSGDLADFTLAATAHVTDSRGGSLDLLSGPVALTAIEPHPNEHIRAAQNRFLLAFDRPGNYPVKVRFSAAVRQADGWNALDFHVAPSVLRAGGPARDWPRRRNSSSPARPGRIAAAATSSATCPPAARSSFHGRRPGRKRKANCSYSAEMLSQINVLPGLMRQTALLNFKVMQGELNRVTLLLARRGRSHPRAARQPGAGAGTSSRWTIPRTAAWSSSSTSRKRTSSPSWCRRRLRWGRFRRRRTRCKSGRRTPRGLAATSALSTKGRCGWKWRGPAARRKFRPSNFPRRDTTRAVFRAAGNQRFVYRFAGADFALRIQADQILPELAVSERLAYHHGENELVIDARNRTGHPRGPLARTGAQGAQRLHRRPARRRGFERLFRHRTARAKPMPSCGWFMASRFRAGNWSNSAWSATRGWARGNGRCRASRLSRRNPCGGLSVCRPIRDFASPRCRPTG